MNWLKKIIVGWAMENTKPKTVASLLGDSAIRSQASLLDEIDGQLSFQIIKAANGRIVKTSYYKPNPRGPDWTHELHIIREGELVTEAIARIMALKALEGMQ